MIRVIYRPNDGPEVDREYPDERLDEILKRADAKFLPPWTAADEMRFREIFADLIPEEVGQA